MRPIVMIAGLALAVGAAPVASHAATCSKRTTGTVLGAVTGGLLGHAVAGRGDHTEGTLIGATVGGVAGNQIAKCNRAPPRTYRSASYRRPAAAPSPYVRASSCHYETRPYYDAYGELVYAPAQVCR